MNFDVAIVGGGLAGLSVALNLARTSRVAIISKRTLVDGASDRAQGGIAAVLDSADSFDDHVRDTLAAGGGMCDEAVARFVVERGPTAIDWLIKEGVSFTRDISTELGFHLTREGGHSRRRIIHSADATGHAVISTLSERVRRHPNITILENHCAIDLVMSRHLGIHNDRCCGLYALDVATGRTVAIEATHTVLATGGAGKVYLHTTNPDGATGDGVAMAWRAGCRVANMEFIQFHPTSLFHPDGKSFLISEAVRGEGGTLRLADGTRFMSAYDERAELAPRDVVARAIDSEIKKHGIDCVYLDISHRPEAFLREHFPTILDQCRRFGIDIAAQPIPVVPAAHYSCGGVVTDLSGRTDCAGLYVVGEASYTGLHGANRLASNSLLECLVVGHAAAEAIQEAGASAGFKLPLPDWGVNPVSDEDEEHVIAHLLDEVRQLMWNCVGLARTDKGLVHARNRLVRLRDEIQEYYENFELTRDLLELRNLVDVASLITESARSRRESRGLHFNRDWPDALPEPRPTMLMPPSMRRCVH